MASLSFHNAAKRFGKTTIIHGANLNIADGEFVVFVGPSGCGKSTLLRMIAGLEDISAGEIRIGDRRVNDIPAGERGAAMVFQSYALYPHMSVRDNISFGLRMSTKLSAEEIDKRVKSAAEALHLSTLLERKPRELSGGQRQRTAIGRAIVREPQVFLLDEPLSNLDAELRAQMRVELRSLHSRLRATMIYVTHDQVEAMTLADRIVVLNGGCIEQEGKPMDLYLRPRNRFVAGFIGAPKMNFFPAVARVNGDNVALHLTSLPDDAVLTLRANEWNIKDGEKVEVGARPDTLVCPDGAQAKTGEARFKLETDASEHLGGESFHYCKTPDGKTVVAETRGDSGGSPLQLRIAPEDAHIFGEDGETRRK